MIDTFDRCRPILFWLMALLILVAGAIFAAPFLGAISWAVVLSVLTYPLYRRLHDRLAKRIAATWAENLAAFTITIMAALIVILPLAIFLVMAGVQIYDFTLEAPKPEPGESGFGIERITAYLDAQTAGIKNAIGAEEFSIQEWIDDNREQLEDALTLPVVEGVKSVVITILTIVIALLTTFYMLKDAHRLREPVLDIVPLPRSETQAVLDRLHGTIWGVFRGIILVALLQGMIAGIAYAIVGIPAAFVWGIVTFLLCIIPLLGSPLVYIPFALILAINGHYGKALFLLLVGFFIISLVDNLLRPFVIGERTGMHAMAVFFALLGGVLVMGPIGVVVGPLVLTLVLAVVDVLRRRSQLAEITAAR